MEHDELEALFEATRAQAEREAAPDVGPPAAGGPPDATTDTATDTATDAAMDACAGREDGQCDCATARALRERVGRMTRELHESLQALRLDRTLADVAAEIPDARNRLKYVTEVSERSAQKVLDTLDELSPLQERTRDDSAALLERWERLLRDRRRPEEGFTALFASTRDHLAGCIERADRMSGLHSEIMMAQDFQDLTGQVCRKIEAITDRIEEQLLALLIDTAPQAGPPRQASPAPALAGPQVVAGRDDAVSSQVEVDELLSKLGF